MSSAGSYSSKFKQMDSEHDMHITMIHQTERMDMIARNKKLQQDTNRRRKALVIKRKLESQREEKRRQEILAKRREQQRQATEKYQRLNTHYRPASVSPPPPTSDGPAAPLLEDALRAVRGSPHHHLRRGTDDGNTGQGSAGSFRSRSRGGANQRGRIGSAGSTGSSTAGLTQHTASGSQLGTDTLNRPYYNTYGHTNGTLNARTAEHAREVAARTELQSNSLRNLTNSRSLFEAHLEHHQQQLAEHQRQALSHFNAAIREEIDTDTTLHGTDDVHSEIVRSTSVSSLDSLEDHENVNTRNIPIGPISRCHSETNLSATLESGTYRSNPPRDGASINPNQLHASQSEVCLPTYATSQKQDDTFRAVTDTTGISQHTAPETFEMNGIPQRGSVTTNTAVSPAGFSLHRSVSSGSNVAVVQPISSGGQKPNSVAAAYVNNAHINHQIGALSTVQPSVKYGGYAEPVTNGYYQGNSDFRGNEGKGPNPYGQGFVEGKDGGLVGPISAGYFDSTSHFNTDHVISNATLTTNAPMHNQFYLGSFTGSTYTAPAGATDCDNKPLLKDEDFHARTKAWTSPSPNVMPTTVTVPTTSAAATSPAAASFASNINPYSSRATATNVTLTTASAVGTTSHTSVYARPSAGPVTPHSYIQNYGTNATDKGQAKQMPSSHATLSSNQGKVNGCYSNNGSTHNQSTVPYSATYGNNHYGPSSGSSSVNNGSHGNSQAGYQSGTVYSKGSIPSTVIVSPGHSQQGENYQTAIPVASHPSNQTGNSESQGSQTTVSIPKAKTYDALAPDDEIDSDAKSDDDEPEEQSQPEPEKKTVKGILKATFNANQPNAVLPPRGRGSDVRGKGYVAAHQARGRGAAQGAGTSGAIVRDSLEVARQHLGSKEASLQLGKKSVRFADQLVEEQEESDVSPQEEPEQPPPPPPAHVKKPHLGKDTSPHRVKGRPPRPVSAKVSSATPKVDHGVRESRIASAGTLRRGPFLRPSTAKVTVNKQSVGESSTGARGSSSANASVQNANHRTSATPVSGPTAGSVLEGPIKSNFDPVYDGNGLRLDRTPTDDEINWLWDKVRTCLSRTSTVASQDTQSQTTDQGSINGRQTATISSKYIDGNSLAPQFRTATRVTQNGNSMAASREPTINGANPYQQQRKKISMEHLNSYARRNSGLLSQRKPVSQAQSVTSQAAPSVSYVTTYNTSHQPPAQSNYSPVTANSNQNSEVTESMAAFLTAEALAQRSVSESHIEDAMEVAQQKQHAFNATKPHQKVPTALSIEEQRLLQSLERLNERLKMTETSVGGPGGYVPRPPPYGRGFRGYQPLSASRRHHSASSAGTVNRHHIRVGSAGNVHTNYGGQVRHH